MWIDTKGCADETRQLFDTKWKNATQGGVMAKSKKETFEFKTEVQQLMGIIINSLYSHPEIFLRELISNASDAIDKIRFKSQTDPEVLAGDTEFKIKLDVDAKKRTLTISDNGIGMTKEETMENVGTIAKSGTGSFLEALKLAKNKDALAPELIGQFGVGFYSAFIVADKVELITRSYDNEKATRWESAGDGSYSIESAKKETRGTTVILHLKKVEKEEQDFTQEWTLRQVVKKHSDFVNYPVVMDVERDEPVLDKDGKPIEGKTNKVTAEETLNSMKAIWTKNKSEVTEDEYKDFYSHLSHDWNPPLTQLHFKMEGVTEYTALLFIPSKAPFDLFNPERQHGVQLYSKRVFIMGDCKELLPEYLRFVKGVVDAADLNLNVSREILQHDRLVLNIRKNLIKKIFDLLKKMSAEDYEKFYLEFGPVLKEGIYTDAADRDKLSELIRFRTTKSDDKLVALKDYVKNMKFGQKHIYYITGEKLSAVLNSPHLEALKAKDYEVLLMTDPVDEWVVQFLTEYDGKPLQSAEKGDLDLDDEKDDEKKKDQKDQNDTFFEAIKKQLEDKIKEVKASSRLKDSLAILSGDDQDMSAYMEKLMKASGQKTPETKRILELNADHPAFTKIKACFEKEPEGERFKELSGLLWDLAIIAEGGKVENPSQFNKMVGELIAGSL